jgi:hypothetical protein
VGAGDSKDDIVIEAGATAGGARGCGESETPASLCDSAVDDLQQGVRGQFQGGLGIDDKLSGGVAGNAGARLEQDGGGEEICDTTYRSDAELAGVTDHAGYGDAQVGVCGG